MRSLGSHRDPARTIRGGGSRLALATPVAQRSAHGPGSQQGGVAPAPVPIKARETEWSRGNETES